jgi:amino acid transporter
MEEIVYKQLLDGFIEFLSYVNWVFVCALLLISWVMLSPATNAKTVNNIAVKWKVFIVGIALIIIFAILFENLREPKELGRMFFGIFTAMGIHKIGLNRLMKAKK